LALPHLRCRRLRTNIGEALHTALEGPAAVRISTSQASPRWPVRHRRNCTRAGGHTRWLCAVGLRQQAKASGSGSVGVPPPPPGPRKYNRRPPNAPQCLRGPVGSTPRFPSPPSSPTVPYTGWTCIALSA